MPRSRLLLIALFALMCSLAGSARAETAHYTFDQDNSSVAFALKHVGIVTVSGNFETFAGSFLFDPNNIEETNVMLLIQAGSVTSDNALRDADLKSENFFWAEKHPEIKFVSHSIQNIRENQFDIHGDLTIRGVTHPTIFQTRLLDQKQDGILIFYTETYISRKDFHLGTENWMHPLMFITAERLKISLEVQGEKAQS